MESYLLLVSSPPARARQLLVSGSGVWKDFHHFGSRRQHYTIGIFLYFAQIWCRLQSITCNQTPLINSAVSNMTGASVRYPLTGSYPYYVAVYLAAGGMMSRLPRRGALCNFSTPGFEEPSSSTLSCCQSWKSQHNTATLDIFLSSVSRRSIPWALLFHSLYLAREAGTRGRCISPLNTMKVMNISLPNCQNNCFIYRTEILQGASH